MRNQKYLGLAIGWTILNLYLGLDSTSNLPKINIDVPNLDKIAHSGIHFVLTILWFFVFYKRKPRIKNALLKAFLISVFYGIFLEFLQNTLTTSRTADIFDIFANVFGAVLAAIFVIYSARFKSISN